jgi:hypothetical protein
MIDTTTRLNKSANLSISNPDIPFSNSSSSYTFSIWINVNSLPTTNTQIFKSYDDNNIELSLDSNSPTLKCTFKTNTTTTNKFKTDIITNNFPIQSWTCITISVDNQFVDYYLNGKLVKSVYNKDVLNKPGTGEKSHIKFGILNATISEFKFNQQASDPQTVWTNYLKGNGQSSITSLNSFNMKVSLLKDQVEQSKFSLF